MKKVFKMVTALTLVCGAFAFTGCTDYEEDINSINNRLDELEGGQIASINEQISSLSDAVDGANDLISSLDGTVDDLSVDPIRISFRPQTQIAAAENHVRIPENVARVRSGRTIAMKISATGKSPEQIGAGAGIIVY